MSTTTASNLTSLDTAYPPKDTLIEWITPNGQIVRGKWLGGAVWMPEGSAMYGYYRPLSWRLVRQA